MDLIQNLLLGASVALTPSNLLYCLLGCFLGTIIGVLPGIGPVATISMLLPVTYSLGPTTSIIMLAGIYYGAQYGSSTTAILINTPGESSSLMTCLDGHQLTKQGKAGLAIFTAGISSFIGGIMAVLAMALFADFIGNLVFEFSPAEYCAIMLLGFLSISAVVTGNVINGIGMACVGILLGCVGTDINSGTVRFSGGFYTITDNIPFATLAIGLFGVSEVLWELTQTKRVTFKLSATKFKINLTDLKLIIPPSIRGSLVGIFTGIIPGGGVTLSSFIAYAFEKKTNKTESNVGFGNGRLEGVAAPEAANNSAAQVGFIPLLTLGLPENAVMALMLAALMINGITPGPMLISSSPEIFWGIAISMLIGNLVLVILNIPLVNIWTKLLLIPTNILYPLILLACCYGAYSVNGNIGDIGLVIIFGLLGLAFKYLSMEPAPLILGFILGPQFEENLRRQLSLSMGDFSPFYTRPISATILVIGALFLVYGLAKMGKRTIIQNSA